MGARQSNSNSDTPVDIRQLKRGTHFTEDELKECYRKFKEDFPSGKINKEQFKQMYHKYFPAGDAERFADNTFRTFDTNNDGLIEFGEFVMGLSVTKRGSFEDRMKWAFDFYDVDGDGFISKAEALEIIQSVFRMSHQTKCEHDEALVTAIVNRMFERFDMDRDGRLCREEFIEGSEADPSFVNILKSDS